MSLPAVTPFRMFDLQLMIAQGRVQGSQIRELSHVPANLARVARLPGSAMTVRVGESVLLCGGLIPEGPRNGLLWALLSKDAGAHMLFLHRGVCRFIDSHNLRRVEATVECGFQEGCRWLTLLGFKSEGTMQAYGVHGEDHWRFAKVTR